MRFGAMVLAFCALGTSACMTTLPQKFGSSEIQGTNVGKDFVPGKTTVYDVHAQLGQPHEVGKDKDGNGTVWRYFYLRQDPSLGSFIPVYSMIGANTEYDKTAVSIYFAANDTFMELDSDRSSTKRSWTASVIDSGTTQAGITPKVEAEMNRLKLPYDAWKAKSIAAALDRAS